MKKILVILLSSLLVAGCAITVFAIADNTGEYDPIPASDLSAIANTDLINEDINIEEPLSSLALVKENLRISAEAIINEPLTYVPTGPYDWKDIIEEAKEKYPTDTTARVINCYQLDEDFMKSLPTEELVEYALNCPGLWEHWLESGAKWRDYVYSYLTKSYNVISELETRPDAAHYLLKKYLKAVPDDECEVKDIFRTRDIEYLLSRKVYAEMLTDEEMQIFVTKYSQNIILRETSTKVSNALNAYCTNDEYVISRYNSACASLKIAPLDVSAREVKYLSQIDVQPDTRQ